LRVSVHGEGCTVRCMKFRTTLEEFGFCQGDRVDLAVTLQEREYGGRKLLSIIIRDMKFSGMNMDAMIAGYALYDRFYRGEPLSPKEAKQMKPDRKEFASVYRALQGSGYCGTPEHLLPRLPAPALGMEKLLIALDVFAERGLIRLKKSADTYNVQMIPPKCKVNLMESKIMRTLTEFEKAGEKNGVAAEKF